MVDEEVFVARLSRLEQLLKSLEVLRGEGRDDYFGSETRKASAERWLQLAGECAIDLANHAIAHRGLRPPVTYRDSFAILAESGVIDEDLASDMKEWAGLRNILVHLYLTIDHEVLWNVVDRELDTMRRYIRAMEALL
jgi:uncharacterized protein YutE (UPF0331/DUF86 family)